MGYSGILEFYLNSLRRDDIDKDLWMQNALRLVANCCLPGRIAHTNRERTLMKHPFELLSRLLLSPDGTAQLAVKVIHSLCDDFGAMI